MDWPHLHAALNDLPAALLLVAVIFEAAGALVKRDSLRAAGFWTLVAGVIGTILAIVAGLEAEDVVEHSEQAHDLMERHETLAFVVLGIFAVLLVWRFFRRAMAKGETIAFITVGVVGVAVLIAAARLGGSLVFDHGLGIRTARLHAIVDERGSEHHVHGSGEAPHDSTGMAQPGH